MQVLPDAVVKNAPPSQREILGNPKYKSFVRGIIVDGESWGRPRIPIGEIANVTEQLRQLGNKEYAKRKPCRAIERIILNIDDAAALQKRTYPASSKLG